jgi:hypothetical protein
LQLLNFGRKQAEATGKRKRSSLLRRKTPQSSKGFNSSSSSFIFSDFLPFSLIAKHNDNYQVD